MRMEEKSTQIAYSKFIKMRLIQANSLPTMNLKVKSQQKSKEEGKKSVNGEVLYNSVSAHGTTKKDNAREKQLHLLLQIEWRDL